MGQTTVLSYLSLMVSPTAEVVPFPWVLTHITIYRLPALQVCLPYTDNSNEHIGEKIIESNLAVLHHVRGAHTLVYIILPPQLFVPLQVLSEKTLRRHKLYCFIISRDAVSMSNFLSKDLCLISFCHMESIITWGLFLDWSFQVLC